MDLQEADIDIPYADAQASRQERGGASLLENILGTRQLDSAAPAETRHERGSINTDEHHRHLNLRTDPEGLKFVMAQLLGAWSGFVGDN